MSPIVKAALHSSTDFDFANNVSCLLATFNTDTIQSNFNTTKDVILVTMRKIAIIFSSLRFL
jgi:hypothetical protein